MYEPKVCFYIMTVDTGFAPNPFYERCTLLGCTPNYVDAKLGAGDYIAGVFRSGEAPRLVYVMKVSQTLEYNLYYRDGRFAKKKPQKDGSWQERAGNNIYYKSESGEYVQDSNACFHTAAEKIEEDLRHPVVFVGRDFAYLGEKAVLLPQRYHKHLPGRGVQYLDYRSPDFAPFLAWGFSHGRGLIGLPRDRGPDSAVIRHGKCRPEVCDDCPAEAGSSRDSPTAGCGN